MTHITLERLPRGFRFHPTDEELVNHYLKRKIVGCIEPDDDVIPEIDVCKCEPWDLPDRSLIKSNDPEWFFFAPKDRKYPNGLRFKRATEAGYWKATGKDRIIRSKASAAAATIGMKKTLVFHRGRAPNGVRTNWIMHEYRTTEKEFETGDQGGYVLYRLFKKPEETSSNANNEELEADNCSPTTNKYSSGGNGTLRETYDGGENATPLDHGSPKLDVQEQLESLADPCKEKENGFRIQSDKVPDQLSMQPNENRCSLTPSREEETTETVKDDSQQDVFMPGDSVSQRTDFSDFPNISSPMLPYTDHPFFTFVNNGSSPVPIGGQDSLIVFLNSMLNEEECFPLESIFVNNYDKELSEMCMRDSAFGEASASAGGLHNEAALAQGGKPEETSSNANNEELEADNCSPTTNKYSSGGNGTLRETYDGGENATPLDHGSPKLDVQEQLESLADPCKEKANGFRIQSDKVPDQLSMQPNENRCSLTPSREEETTETVKDDSQQDSLNVLLNSMLNEEECFPLESIFGNNYDKELSEMCMRDLAFGEASASVGGLDNEAALAQKPVCTVPFQFPYGSTIPEPQANVGNETLPSYGSIKTEENSSISSAQSSFALFNNTDESSKQQNASDHIDRVELGIEIRSRRPEFLPNSEVLQGSAPRRTRLLRAVAPVSNFDGEFSVGRIDHGNQVFSFSGFVLDSIIESVMKKGYCEVTGIRLRSGQGSHPQNSSKSSAQLGTARRGILLRRKCKVKLYSLNNKSRMNGNTEGMVAMTQKPDRIELSQFPYGSSLSTNPEPQMNADNGSLFPSVSINTEENSCISSARSSYDLLSNTDKSSKQKNASDHIDRVGHGIEIRSRRPQILPNSEVLQGTAPRRIHLHSPVVPVPNFDSEFSISRIDHINQELSLSGFELDSIFASVMEKGYYELTGISVRSGQGPDPQNSSKSSAKLGISRRGILLRRKCKVKIFPSLNDSFGQKLQEPIQFCVT